MDRVKDAIQYTEMNPLKNVPCWLRGNEMMPPRRSFTSDRYWTIACTQKHWQNHIPSTTPLISTLNAASTARIFVAMFMASFYGCW
jgi:hypothetical protein